MDASTFWVQQEMRKVEGTAHGALQRIRMATTIAETVRAADIPIPAIVHPLKHQIRGLQLLRQATEQRLTELVQAQILKALPMSAEDAKAYLGSLRQREWALLRGAWASAYRLADHEARRLLSQLDAVPRP